MKRITPWILFLVLSLYLSACASVSDSVISAIDEEQFNQLNEIFRLLQDFRINNNRTSLKAARDKLEKIDSDEIYNADYKARIIGLKALSSFYLGKRFETEKLLKELKELTIDEEMYWIVSSLLLEDKKERLDLLLKGMDSVYTINRMNSFLAYAYMENENYGEASALYDTILLEETDFTDYYKTMRDLSFLFMKNPPSSFETGLIISGDQILLKDLIDIFSIETPYFSDYKSEEIKDILKQKRYFFDNPVVWEVPLVRKDLAFFLFALIADRNNDEAMWRTFDENFTPDLSDERKDQLEKLSPVPDVPAFRYYFYPVLYLVEEELMELPDGEHFFPREFVDGTDLMNIIANLKQRLD